VQRLLIVALATCAGCATPYAYHFQLAETPVPAGDTFEDALVKARLRVDGDAIKLDLTNKTDEVMQVQWSKIKLDRGDGTTTALHAAADLGWITPGASAQADLVPVAFPHEGDAALAYQNRRIELAVPVIAKREPSTYHFHFVVSVKPE
jgi:hypothetical protein